jgi:hypothetical protein
LTIAIGRLGDLAIGRLGDWAIQGAAAPIANIPESLNHSITQSLNGPIESPNPLIDNRQQSLNRQSSIAQFPQAC